MDKKLRQIILGLLTVVIISNVMLTNVQASEEGDSMHKVTITEEDQKENDEKLKLAEEYARNRERIRGYGQTKTVSMSPVLQMYSYYCGPATAYAVTNGRLDQVTAAQWLGTTTGGTDFGPNWKRTLDTFR